MIESPPRRYPYQGGRKSGSGTRRGSQSNLSADGGRPSSMGYFFRNVAQMKSNLCILFRFTAVVPIVIGVKHLIF